ncbi:hypothetical protein KDH_80020 [Dictyobacter sp. S3.2.2.5]|uniref:PilZ domain-containing protein n=1 Tax=Dictyobacter halimunensis TaxID=3026934 RepID=A0ABQ6G8N7_9CHLR|nr:hypothetical protein KDH_80020 [Dictyobacter sp. S3.2.2.5]
MTVTAAATEQRRAQRADCYLEKKKERDLFCYNDLFMQEASMEDTYIYLQGEGETGIFIKESTVTSVRCDLAQSTAVITTSDSDECYTVVGYLAVHQLHDHFYQYSKLKLFRYEQ